MFIAGGMTIFSYEWLEKYFDQKEKLHLAAIEVGILKLARTCQSTIQLVLKFLVKNLLSRLY